MSLIIKIVDATVENSTIKGRNGNFDVQRQYGVVDMPDGERRKVRIPVPRNQPAYTTGSYTMSEKSFAVGDWGELKVGFLVLEPLRPAPVQPSQRVV